MSEQSLDALLMACTPWQQEVVRRLLAGERFTVSIPMRSGRRYADWLAIRLLVARGDVIHLARPDGAFCTGGHEDCALPRWDGEM